MIEKITKLKNLAVFKDFDWDSSVVDSQNQPLLLKPINIIYGRNYSGKTTLSRVIRSMETGTLTEKYENREFKVNIGGESEITHLDPTAHSKKIRVFNEDFVKENLAFISNPDLGIQPFAILGEGNGKLVDEIKTLQTELGIEENKEKEVEASGLYLKNKTASQAFIDAKRARDLAENKLDGLLSRKATGANSIKSKHVTYGDINYNKGKLKTECDIVVKDSYTPLNEEQKERYHKIIKERVLITIPIPPDIDFTIDSFLKKAEALVTKPLESSDKIEELVKNGMLAKWVKDGLEHHKEKNTNCLFCDNEINESRWTKLEQHFDKASSVLEKEIDALILEIEKRNEEVEKYFQFDKNLFYSKYHASVEELNQLAAELTAQYQDGLNSIIKELSKRKRNIFQSLEFLGAEDYSNDLNDLLIRYESFRIESNKYKDALKTDQDKARKALRLDTVCEFVNTMNYSVELTTIESLKVAFREKQELKEAASKQIEDLKAKIESKKAEEKDESLGAEKVNEYLNNYFGHQFLTLKPVEDEENDKKIQFQVIRNMKQAFNLSEGESSLIAFCYFMAKLEDDKTAGFKPIIWIDDPISSLDGDHIFFIYSLIKAKIVNENKFEQLTISTHNLDFLKYLKRLTGGFINANSKFQSYDRKFFIISREIESATINVMPNYLKEYITEFNFLFNEILKCSEIVIVDDANYHSYFNFGNNARKFLEIFLYYKYPDNSDDSKKYELFFGSDKIPSILAERINNEYSHLSGGLERGAMPIEVPEMKKAAFLIIEKIKEDNDQYCALMRSIGREISV